MTFEELEAWRQARTLVKRVYEVTRKGRLAEDHGLIRQIQRASVSVMSNIAEGFERSHVAEKLQAYNVARGSIAEVRSLLYVIEDNYPGDEQETAELRNDADRIGKLVSGLIRSTGRRKR